MSKINDKLTMLGYNKAEFNGTNIFHNEEKHSVIVVDKKGNKMAKTYSGKLTIEKCVYYLTISCGLEDIDEPFNIVITSDGTVYDLNWGEHVVEYDNFIAMQSEHNVLLYNKETNTKHRIEIFECLQKNNAEFILDSSSNLKLIAEDKLLIDNTYIDFKEEKIYQFEINPMGREFIRIESYQLVSYSKYGVDSESNRDTTASINGSSTYFLLDLTDGQIYKVLSANVINSFKTMVAVSDFDYRNEKELLIEHYEYCDYDSDCRRELLWI